MALDRPDKRADRCRKTGKAAHREYYAAARHLKRLAKRAGEPVGALDVYVCEYCGCWHIGHHRRDEATESAEETAPAEEVAAAVA
jgi:hypothetical protein